MAIQPDSKSPSRRALLAGALGGIGAWAASAIGRPAAVRALGPGDNGQTIHIADTWADVQGQTTLGDAATDDIVLWVASNSGGGHGGGTAVVGYSDHGIGLRGLGAGSNIGVRGESSSSYGVWGSSGSTNVSRGVFGTAVNGDGVFGESSGGTGVVGGSTSGAGVYGYSDANYGVYGDSSASNKPAVLGLSRGNATAVQGHSGALPIYATPANTGVFGYADQNSTAKGIYGKSSKGFAGFFLGKVYLSKYQEMTEITAPAAPVANHARLFLKDNGSGLTQLCVRFHTGAIKVLATEG